MNVNLVHLAEFHGDGHQFDAGPLRLPEIAAMFAASFEELPTLKLESGVERVRALGIAVPDVVAVGEHIGPGADLRSFLMVAELTGCLPLHEAIPAMASSLEREAFAARKRALVQRMAEIVATLHRAHAFHKDLYLCHFYVDVDRLDGKLFLIDLHRLSEHRWSPDRWRWKDLGQLLFPGLEQSQPDKAALPASGRGLLQRHGAFVAPAAVLVVSAVNDHLANLSCRQPGRISAIQHDRILRR